MEESEKGELARILTTLGAEVVLRPDPTLGDGLVLTARMQDPREGKSLSVYLDPEAAQELGANLVGFALAHSFKPIADLLKDEDEDEKE